MNIFHANPIIDVYPGTPLSDLTQGISMLTTCVGLLVYDDASGMDCREVLSTLPVPCAGIAFVTRMRFKLHRRMAAELGLSSHHACVCRLFGDEVRARLWLKQLVCR